MRAMEKALKRLCIYFQLRVGVQGESLSYLGAPLMMIQELVIRGREGEEKAYGVAVGIVSGRFVQVNGPNQTQSANSRSDDVFTPFGYRRPRG